MDRDEARKRILEIRALITGHPPGDPVEKLKKIGEIVNPSRDRKAITGRDRQERGGYDREA
jgi:hypothetical protein